MSNTRSALTILTCHGKGKRAAKKFFMQDDGKVSKDRFDAGVFFTHKEIPISNLKELKNVIEDISNKPRKCIIRGRIKENMPEVVRRKMYDPNAAFDPVPRPYVMLDIDKFPCPDFFDLRQNPEEAVKWVLDNLPKPFKDVSCYYKFSSSQNVPKHIEAKPLNEISIHLWFWCDRDILDEEWKRYFKSVFSSVDQALFSCVQAHFTATPLFENMSDPLPIRSGILKGESDVVNVPLIPKSETKKLSKRSNIEPVVDKKNIKQAMDLLSDYYKEGSRNRLSGAIATTLYRGGWNSENVANFIYDLAEKNNDPEANERHDNALRICGAVDDNLPAQGIPTLKNEFNVEQLDDILSLFGLGKPDVESNISQLSSKSEIQDVKQTLIILLSFSNAEQELYLDKISKLTPFNKAALKALLKEVATEKNKIGPQDLADTLMEILLSSEYQSGRNLLYTSDKLYWQYNGRYWEKIPEQKIKKLLLPHAREMIAEIEGGSVPSFNNAILNILEGRVFREKDILRYINSEPPMVINCQNGELWFDDSGNTTLKPHCAESYLRSCLTVDYNPSAKSPMFDKAVLDIFSNSTDPEDMYRHFMEVAGYICQPWRKLAVIILLYGGGSNGKTSLIKVVRRMLGENTIMSDRISDIEGNVFKIGDLDGKLMLLDDDVDGGTLLPDGFLKKISEEKSMTGQHKHKPPFEFVSRAVPVMLANDYPVTRDLTKGIRRRLMVIPFNRTFENHEIKVDLFDNIWEEEGSGILNNIIAGFQRVKKRGMFLEPQDSLKAKKEWIVRANILTTFIDECCAEGDSYKEYLGDFYQTFIEYCRETGVRNIQSRKLVKSRLQDLGYRIGISNGKDAVWGIQFTRIESVPMNNKVKLD